MKICFIGPANSAHIVKWCNWFVNRGHEIYVISFESGTIDGVHVYVLDTGVNSHDSDLKKIKYMFSGNRIKALCDEIKPDIISVHYATSYGVAVALSGIKEYILSVWGSDIYEFPNKSVLHKALLRYSLKHATHLFSTSAVMAKETNKYTNKTINVTPFGVDMNLFNPLKRTRNDSDDRFVFGTVKALNEAYGIEDILQATKLLREKRPDIKISVRIAGKGPKEDEYRRLAKELSIDDVVTFLGFISQECAAMEWANMDVAVIPSVNESFGVSAIEAQASGTPVIVSNAPGLLEVTEPGRSSVVVSVHDPETIADTLIELWDDKNRINQMSIDAREYTVSNYEINKCFLRIESYFKSHAGRIGRM